MGKFRVNGYIFVKDINSWTEVENILTEALEGYREEKIDVDCFDVTLLEADAEKEEEND